MAWSSAQSPPLVLALLTLCRAVLVGLAHPTAGPGDAFLSLLLFQASSVAVPGCLLSETHLEWTQPTQRAAPQRQAVSKRAACVRAALSCETTAPCRAWDGTSGALTTFQLGSAPSLPEIPMGDSIALYSPSELLRSPFHGQWKWLLGVMRTANNHLGAESWCACVHRCAYTCIYFFKNTYVLNPLQHESCES